MTDSALYTKQKNAEVSDKERLPTQEKHEKACFCRGYLHSIEGWRNEQYEDSTEESE